MKHAYTIGLNTDRDLTEEEQIAIAQAAIERAIALGAMGPAARDRVFVGERRRRALGPAQKVQAA